MSHERTAAAICGCYQCTDSVGPVCPRAADIRNALRAAYNAGWKAARESDAFSEAAG